MDKSISSLNTISEASSSSSSYSSDNNNTQSLYAELPVLTQVGDRTAFRDCSAQFLLPKLTSAQEPSLSSSFLRSSLLRSQDPTTPSLAEQERLKLHDNILQQMETMRQQMKAGIEEMQLRMYQIQYCAKQLATEVTTVAPSVPKCPSSCLSSVQMSPREYDQWGTITSAIVQKQTTSDSPTSSALDVSQPSSSSQGAPSSVVSVSPFQPTEEDPPVPDGGLSSVMEASSTPQRRPRLLEVFCVGRRRRGAPLQDKGANQRLGSKVLETARVFTRSCGKTNSVFLRRRRRSKGSLRMGGRKFTDKYPVDADSCQSSTAELLKSFSSRFKSDLVSLNGSSLDVARLIKNAKGTGWVFTADGVESGIARFSLTSCALTGWCFVGIVSRENLANNVGNPPHWSFSSGWDNVGEIFSEERYHETEIGHRSNTASEVDFQVLVDTRVGTAHLRVQRKSVHALTSPQICEFTEYEVQFDPSVGSQWHLGIQWSGKEAEFRLNSVEKWQ